MGFDFTHIAGPAIGAVIGYITNDIAIRMLFRPHQAKYIFGVHVPFTPGIIPKERGRIAASVGAAISENLMNKEVLEKYLLSEDMIAKVQSANDDFFSTQKSNKETLREFLSHYLTATEIERTENSVNEELTKLLYHKLAESSVGDQIAHIAVTHVMRKMQNLGSGIGDTLKDEGIGSGGGIGNMISRGIESIFGSKAKNEASNFISALATPVEQALAKNINEMLQNNSEEIVGNLIGDEINNLMARRMCDLLEGKDDKIEQIKVSIVAAYTSVIRNNLPKILNAINISKIVENRINEMDVNETERLIFAVMDKELKAIVWLGAGLGFIMGFINAII